MISLLQASISKKAVLHRRLDPILPVVEGDATQIRQIIMNLVINASEALGNESGEITLTTGVVHADRAYLARTYLGGDRREGEYIYLEVADTGCGMDEETRSKIFDPFFTTKFTGRGLGLAATLGIIRAHSGAVGVDSEPGRGSAFRVLLPHTSDEAPRKEARQDKSSIPWKSTGTILIIDDDATVCDVASRVVQKLGFNALTARDGQQGVDIYREHAADIALVLLDLTMPRLGGEEVFAALRRIRPDVRVILSSGYDQQDAAGRFSGRGPAGFIQKPYRFAELEAKLREILCAPVHKAQEM